METSNQIFCVDRQEINYLRVIIESYDGMAIVRTIDPYDALIEIQISPGCEDIVPRPGDEGRAGRAGPSARPGRAAPLRHTSPGPAARARATSGREPCPGEGPRRPWCTWRPPRGATAPPPPAYHR